MHRTRATARLALAMSAVMAALAHVSATSTSAAQDRAAASGDDAALVQALRAGGLVLVMRHANSPRDAPTPEAAKPDNTTPNDSSTTREYAAPPPWAMRCVPCAFPSASC